MAGKQQTDSQRIRYFDGQLLTARDLRDDVAYEARMRGLHVRALHNTWGVALGLAVTVQNNNVVKVSPGIAYDCRGRELFSARDLLIGPPPRPLGSQVNAWLFDLVIRYDESGERGRADSVLCTDGVNPGEERPLWRWRFAGDAVGFTPTSTTAPRNRSAWAKRFPWPVLSFSQLSHASARPILQNAGTRRGWCGRISPMVRCNNLSYPTQMAMN